MGAGRVTPSRGKGRGGTRWEEHVPRAARGPGERNRGEVLGRWSACAASPASPAPTANEKPCRYRSTSIVRPYVLGHKDVGYNRSKGQKGFAPTEARRARAREHAMDLPRRRAREKGEMARYLYRCSWTKAIVT